MAGGVIETDPEKLAQYCEAFQRGAKRIYEGDRLKGCKGDMWFFELYHHMTDCANALRKRARAPRASEKPMPAGLKVESEAPGARRSS